VNYAPSVVLFASIPFCLLVWRNALLYPNVGFSCCSGDFTKRDVPVHILGFSIGNMECAA